ncbi:hypothetical protein ALC56_08111, partial [Trachymyrmex septentrionalis]
KFVTIRTIEDSINLQNTTDDFLKTVKLFIEQFGSKNVFNSDRSGFQLEIYSGRLFIVLKETKDIFGPRVQETLFTPINVIKCDIESCSNIAVVRCSWCKKSLYLKHFFIEYYYCNEYNE